MTRPSLLALLASFALCACDGQHPAPQHDAGMEAADGSVAVDAGGDTWNSFAKGFFESYCTACHDTSPKDFHTLADVRAWSAEIRCGVSAVALDGCGAVAPPGQFPVGTGPHPSDAERARLVAWIDAGMPE